MKILKLLNKTNLSIIIISLLYNYSIMAEEQPVDIWNLEKQKKEISSEKNSSNIISDTQIKNSIYEMQNIKQTNTIKLDSKLVSKNIKIVGLYDPEEYGLDINMWSNSDGLNLKKFFEKIKKLRLSDDAKEILNISLLTNAYYPNENITKDEFLKLKSDWLIEESNFKIIEDY